MAHADELAARGNLRLVAELGEELARRGLRRFCAALPEQLTPAQLQAASEEFTRKLARLGLMRATGALAAELTGAGAPAPAPEELTPPESPFVRANGAGAVIAPDGSGE